MKPMRGGNPNFDMEPDNEEWDNNGPKPNFGNFRNERYSNAFGDYRGGYGPMNSGGFRPMNSGGFGPMNMGGGFRPMNSAPFGPPRGPFMGPPPGNFFPGPRPLFPPGEPFMMGRGFGPGGPNKFKKNNDRPLRFLLRCGVPKENLKNLPSSLLELMEQEHCGLCAIDFTSYAVARTHYCSKNHLKNQKKWLSHHSDAGYGQCREIPLKSRELYCELCDVHITSKSHAESHYAGKPHRAIVEGRKMPRNPSLMQRSMSNRLEQLIRREKKNMKPIDEGEDKEVESVKENKSVQPELYCEICKTSVTCTDQMTMHLNGKRHLSKEKQHILKMMKGENNDDKSTQNQEDDEDGEDGEDEDEGEETGKTEADDEEGEEETKEGNGESQEKGGNVAAADDYDWGNGSGAWDEPETN